MKVIVICVLVLLTACTSSTPSASDIQTAIAQTQIAGGVSATATVVNEPTSLTPLCSIKEFDDAFYDLGRRFDDAVTLASNTPRIQLPLVISQMQEILRETEKKSPPDCYTQLYGNLIGYMDETIKRYTNFLSEQSTSQNGINAALYLKKYQIEYGEHKITDGLLDNTIRQVTDEILFNVEQELDSASRVRYYVTNSSDISAVYVTIGVFFDLEDGTKLKLQEEYYPVLMPKEEVVILYDRLRSDLIKGVETEKTYIEILEAYIPTE